MLPLGLGRNGKQTNTKSLGHLEGPLTKSLR